MHAAQEKANRIAERVRCDPHAPHYHFISPEGDALPFDPNGALFWNGRYHLFYIFQDPDLPHGGHCWGHASSRDLLHWEFHPTALAPAPGDPETGIFSGGAFVNKAGVPTIIYHGVGAGTCIATAEDDQLIHWKKSLHNPVIPETRPGGKGWGVYNVFDPHAWLEGETYYVILGGKVKPYDIWDTAYLFASDDLISWDYLRPFYSPYSDWTGPEEDCACPDFFKLGDRYMLICISHPRGTRYYMGRYQDGTFVPEEHQRMNWAGGSCFASESLLDDRQRRIFWAWVIDQRRSQQQVKKELGVMTLPRLLSLDRNGRLHIQPAGELEALRRNARGMGPLRLAVDEEVRLEIHGDVLELEVEAILPADCAFGVKVRMSPDGSEQTSILVDTAARTLVIDTSHSSLDSDFSPRHPLIGSGPQAEAFTQTAPFQLDPAESLKLRIYVDKSILEVYANGRQCITQRIYPTRADSQGTAVFSQRGIVDLELVQGWDITPTNIK